MKKNAIICLMLISALIYGLDIVKNTTVNGKGCDTVSWTDQNGKTRSIALVRADGDTGSYSGGYIDRYTYYVDDTLRTCNSDESMSGVSGLGNTVNHYSSTAASGKSATGASTGFILEGANHCIWRFQGTVSAGGDVDITVDYFIQEGRGDVLWASSYDCSAHASGTIQADARGPYFQFDWDGDGNFFNGTLSGIRWGDTYKFKTISYNTTTPADSSWDYSELNTVPYMSLYKDASRNNTEASCVQTQTWEQQDAGGYWWYSNRGNTGSGMPEDYNCPYQLNAYEGYGGEKMAWGTNYGYVGNAQYNKLGDVLKGVGHPYQGYSVMIILNKYTEGLTDAMVGSIEAVQNTTLSASVGSVVTQGPDHVGLSATTTYQPAGWDHKYGLWSVQVNGSNQASVNCAVSSGTLKRPGFVFTGYTASGLPSTVTLNSGALSAGTHYTASVDTANDLLYLTLKSDLSGSSNLLSLNGAAGNPVPTADAGDDQTVTDTDENGSEDVTLDGSGSSDDGTITSYTWREGGTQIATGVNPAVTLDVGEHTIILTVEDDDGAAATDTVIITIEGGAPVVTSVVDILTTQYRGSYTWVGGDPDPAVIVTGTGTELVHSLNGDGNEEARVEVTSAPANGTDGSGWGAGIPFKADWSTQDLSSYTGAGFYLQFEARVASGSGQALSLGFQVNGMGSAMRPINNYGGLTTEWQEFRIPMTELDAAGAITDWTAVNFMIFQSWPAVAMDLYIREIRIVKVTQGGGGNQNGARIFIFAGQSNMSGSQTDTPLLPANLLAIDTDVKAWKPAQGDPESGVNWVPASGEWQDYQPASIDGAAWWEYFNAGEWWGGQIEEFGPEVTCVRDIQDGLGETIYLVKYSLGATGLADDWQSDQSLYTSMRSWANMALADLQGTDPGAHIAGFFWMQGENDSFVQAQADAYQANLTAFIAQVRSDFGNPGMPFILGRIHADNPGSYTDTVRAAQMTVADGDSNAAWVNIDDEPLVPNGENSPIHFGNDGEIVLGERMAAAYLGLVGSVSNEAPSANAGVDQTIMDSDGNGSETVDLDGTFSSDDSGIAAWSWMDGSTEVSTSSTDTITLDVGVHTIELTVTDGEGLTDTDTVIITVLADNDADDDGMDDDWELDNDLDPGDPDDADEDGDSDGLDNLDEYQYGTDPSNPDTDGDEVSDGDEITAGTDPTVFNQTLRGKQDGQGCSYSGNSSSGLFLLVLCAMILFGKRERS